MSLTVIKKRVLLVIVGVVLVVLGLALISYIKHPTVTKYAVKYLLGIQKQYYLKDCMVKLNFQWPPTTTALIRKRVDQAINVQIIKALESGEFPLFFGGTTGELKYSVFYYTDQCEDRRQLVEALIEKYLVPHIPDFPEYEIVDESIEPGFDGTMPSGEFWLDDLANAYSGPPDNPREQSRVDVSPLMQAAKAGRLADVRRLLAAGADAHARDQLGRTALHGAVVQGHPDVVMALLAAGADVHARDKEGGTSLHWAVYQGHADIGRLLLAAGAAVDARDQAGLTALHWAARQGHADVGKILLAAGADVDARDHEGATVLHWAAYQGHAGIVKMLFTAGAAVNARDQAGLTALHWAAYQGHADIGRLLLLAGADVHARDQYGWMSLHWAAHSGPADMVAALLAAGANPTATTNAGQTPLQLAAYNGHADVAAIFQQAEGRRLLEERPNSPTPSSPQTKGSPREQRGLALASG